MANSVQLSGYDSRFIDIGRFLIITSPLTFLTAKLLLSQNKDTLNSEKRLSALKSPWIYSSGQVLLGASMLLSSFHTANRLHQRSSNQPIEFLAAEEDM